MLRCKSQNMPPVKRCPHWFCLGKRCQRQPSTNHYNHVCVKKTNWYLNYVWLRQLIYLVHNLGINLSFSYTHVDTYGWLKVVFGIIFPGKNAVRIFFLGKTCHEGMFWRQHDLLKQCHSGITRGERVHHTVTQVFNWYRSNYTRVKAKVISLTK